MNIWVWGIKWNEVFQMISRTDGHPLNSLFLVHWNWAFQKVTRKDEQPSNSPINYPMKWGISKGTEDRWTSLKIIIPSSMKWGISKGTEDRWNPSNSLSINQWNGVFQEIPRTDGHTSNSPINNPMKWGVSKGTVPVDRWTSVHFIIPSSLKSGISKVTKDRWTFLKFNNKLPNGIGYQKWYRGQIDFPSIH